jgi:deazaflavin-dependent oxidoreductase (nitroreductase family)
LALDKLTRRLFPVFAAANRTVYEWTGGRIGGRLRGAPILLLRVRGRKTGKLRITPLLYLAEGTRYAVVASAGGAPRHPAWFLNLRDSREAEIQIGRERLRVSAREASLEERKRLWPKLVAMWPDYETYQGRTQRTIPVVVLEPREV